MSIKVDKITDNPDGSADMVLTCDDETIGFLIEQGMSEVYTEISTNVSTPDVLEPYSDRCKTLTLTDEQAQLLFQVGAVSIMRTELGIDNKIVA
jgi:hypothetical protein